jgi:Dolichyl-phosphate-mannose-protein mannosyltransferase
LEQRAAACERFLYRFKFQILAILTILYFVMTMLRARGKPFWYDEILTLLEARQPNLSAALHAGGKADWMPPLSHVVFYVTDKLVGHGEVAFRLGPMIGFWVFCLCLFAFVARRASISFAFMAMLLPFASLFSAYSFEARSYALVLGCCGIALLAWQTAADGLHRPFALVALSAAIACALLNHYWAVFVYLPLAGAEAWRNYRQRKIDWPVWIAFAAGGVPLAISLLVILRVAQTNQHPWSWARIRDYYRFYWNFWPVIGFLIPIALLIGLWLLLGGRKETPAGDRPSTFRDYEWLAAALFLLAPMAAITGALLIPPHIYVDRYLALSTTGFALLITFAAARWAGPRAAIGIACAIAALAPFLFHFTQIHAKRSRDPYTRARLLRKELGTSDQPVVISNYIAFLEVWYYAPDDVKPRILCLDDEKAAVKYRHMDDVAGDSLRDIGVPFHPYGEFATSGKQFKIYFVGWSWITNKILEDGGSVEWLDASDRSGGLLRARIK